MEEQLRITLKQTRGSVHESFEWQFNWENTARGIGNIARGIIKIVSE